MADKNSKAVQKWNEIPKDVQDRLVENVYCGKCGETTIVEYTINDDKFGIILNGKCKQCGESVVRLIED